MRNRHALVIGLGLALLGPAAAAESRQAPDGFIYGTVYAESGNQYTGLLRWGTEEAFWDDLFNSTKRDLPYLEDHRSETRKRNRIKIFGIPVGYRWDDSSTARMFVARFGDIAEIDVRRGENVRVTMKDGEVYDMEGGSNDIGATVSVLDEALGDVKVEWNRIDRIVFRPTPRNVEPPAYRLYGVVRTDTGTFEGHIQWDVQECLSTDKLDGETDDGDLSIEMGHIRAIEKRNSRGSRVELKDGRELVLEGTNDVDDSMRGIHVDDPRFGRVKVSWEAFERIEFREVADSGRGYDDYKPGRPLTGKVTDTDGATHRGTLIYDLDEARSWELLHGDRDDVEYMIPFEMVRSVEPRRGDSSNVVLTSGVEIVLADGQDVSERNDGVVVLDAGGKETYVPWDQVQKVELDGSVTGSTGR